MMPSNRARGSGQKFKHIKFHLSVRTYFFLLGGLLNTGIDCPERLSPSLEIFKTQLHSPGPPDVGDPALNRGVGLDDLQSK